MNIRTITIGLASNYVEKLDELQVAIKSFISDTRSEYERNKCEIRTIRLNLPAVYQKGREQVNEKRLYKSINLISDFAESLGIRWFNVPFDTLNISDIELPNIIHCALRVLKSFPKSFVNFIVADRNFINYNAIIQISKFIKSAGSLDSTGYNNFRVGVSCNPRADTPFFPFTHSSGALGFSIGLELPPVINRIIREVETIDLAVIRAKLVDEIMSVVIGIETSAKKVSRNSKITFQGIDLSIAPFPHKDGSVAALIEQLGVDYLGSNGTLFITSYLTDILKHIEKKGRIKTAGFNGVMYSLLEDEYMGKRNNNKIYSIDSLTSYSAVCGCGLDMVPLPGDIFEEEITSIILDIAGLSTVLRKPLGVRLLPIPMKNENEFTHFNMDFLYNTRIKKVKNLSLLNDELTKKKFAYLSKCT